MRVLLTWILVAGLCGVSPAQGGFRLAHPSTSGSVGRPGRAWRGAPGVWRAPSVVGYGWYGGWGWRRSGLGAYRRGLGWPYRRAWGYRSGGVWLGVGWSGIWVGSYPWYPGWYPYGGLYGGARSDRASIPSSVPLYGGLGRLDRDRPVRAAGAARRGPRRTLFGGLYRRR